MKTRISKLAAALFFAFVIAGNVNAIDYKVLASSHENTQETSMELENWMMNDDIWNPTDLRFVEAGEANLEVENWMTCTSVWDVQLETLEVENWMINEDVWTVKNTFTQETETDQDLAIENWMTNKKIWKM